jgi:3-dehydroquinate synthase
VRSISVRHAAGSYDVLIAPGLAAEAGDRIRSVLPGRRLAVITDETLEQRFDGWGLKLDAAATVTVPAGEVAKNRAEWGRVTDALLAAGIGRDSVIVAVGGGSVGDLAGFVASTYMRGVPVVQVPTTLLAMVDASVGGKVGVDTAMGKNLVGAFHPPAVVLIDPDLLTALPDRFYREGLAEAVKHGVVADAGYFDWIVASADALERRRGDEVTELVRRSVEIKAGVVARDERESGERAILNAGHTIGHALELLSGFQLRHGEAIAIGLVEECIIGEALGVTAKGTAAKVAAALTKVGLPVTHDPRPTTRDLLAAMRTDKKNRAGEIRMALPVTIGTMARDGALWTVVVEEGRVGG